MGLSPLSLSPSLPLSLSPSSPHPLTLVLNYNQRSYFFEFNNLLTLANYYGLNIQFF